MAYNVLKGSVEGSVDQHGDQEIGGVKVFKNTISASMFYDTDAGSPCATMKDVAITKVKGASKNSVLISDSDTGARSHHTLTYDGDTLESAGNMKAKLYFGSAEKMNNIPANMFNDTISAKYINHGLGLKRVRNSLSVAANRGLACDEDGVSVVLNSSSCLSFKNNKISVSPEKAEPINTSGQNLADQDLLIVSDVSRNAVNNTTLKNLFDSFIWPRLPKASGDSGEVQMKTAGGFGSSAKLTFDASKNILSVDGRVEAESIVVDRKLTTAGAVCSNIIKVTDSEYEVQSHDYTILCDTQSGKVSVKLPPPCENKGRILIIKKADGNKYRISSEVVEIYSEEGRIDISNRISMKMNYSSRTIQSDGENWWVLGAKGN